MLPGKTKLMMQWGFRPEHLVARGTAQVLLMLQKKKEVCYIKMPRTRSPYLYLLRRDNTNFHNIPYFGKHSEQTLLACGIVKQHLLVVLQRGMTDSAL